MRFHILGSGTTVPDPERGPAGFLIELADRHILVDGGSGTLQRCARAGFDPRQVSDVIYSHRHPDHCADLMPLLFAMRVGPPPRMADLDIWAGDGFADYFRALQDLYGRWIALPNADTHVHELPLNKPGEAQLGALHLTTRPANHGAGALHLSFAASGLRVVFSGDTGPSDALVELASGADLLVCECASTDADPHPGHLTPAHVAAIVDAARPSAVWLTHFYPASDVPEAIATVAATGVPTRRAADGDCFPLR